MKSPVRSSIFTLPAFIFMLLLTGAANVSAHAANTAVKSFSASDNQAGEIECSEALPGAETGPDVLVSRMSSMMASPVIVTAADLVTKIYGAIDIPSVGYDKEYPVISQKQEILKEGKALHLHPEEDETGMWLDSTAGYRVSFSGMAPDVSAVAQFDNDDLSSFGYFFMFPYSAGQRDAANRSQCEFCGALLQEMFDMGSIVGVPVDDDAIADPLFTALGSYDGNHINVSLREQRKPDASGRFLLVLEVTPDVYNLYDSVMAMEP